MRAFFSIFGMSERQDPLPLAALRAGMGAARGLPAGARKKNVKIAKKSITAQTQFSLLNQRSDEFATEDKILAQMRDPCLSM